MKKKGKVKKKNVAVNKRKPQAGHTGRLEPMGVIGTVTCLGADLPISGDLYASGNAVSGFSVAIVDANFLTDVMVVRALFAGAEFLTESRLLAITTIFLLSGEAGFVTFPSDARSLIR